MKNSIKYILLLLITTSFFSCEEENNFQEPDIQLTSVYTLTDIDVTDAPVKINIYREKNLIIEYVSDVTPLSFTSNNYSDTSDDVNYQISVTKTDDTTSYSYVIAADRVTGDGTLTIDGTTVYNITVIEDQVYN
ncbi:hypothetical protein IMCC3317_46250 [Kordia antarctica]|uniref:Uncharacterized protein n=1 Tax=Kordia antarctica TaxID=1218801 RepID=A0A7L4ZS06_9FLAO|nr:hypothetical protein [Kordia antarctica]QHI39220.1 hypothetical protein IMCC3317_46250 [Kordia antarctica]